MQVVGRNYSGLPDHACRVKRLVAVTELDRGCHLRRVVGRNYAGVPDNPCRVKRIPSHIPAKQWYLRPPVIALMGGLLPFGSIFIEMYFIFTSFWNYKARPPLPNPCLLA